MIYGARSNGNHHGLVITRPEVVNFMLDRVNYIESNDLRNIIVIEPAAGDGAFAIEIIDRLYNSSKRFGFSFEKALANIVFYELDSQMAAKLKTRISEKLEQRHISIPPNLVIQEDFLISNPQKCDLIIGNPPYVRHENIPESKKSEYKNRFSTFTHRSDLYIPFFEKGLKLLNRNGILSFICSNRWLKNQYGRKLRDLIHSSFSLKEIIDLENASPFEENVIAYPAIATICNSPVQNDKNYFKIDILEDLVKTDCVTEPERTLETSNSHNWFTHMSGSDYNKMVFDSIENQGFRIGIGVATGSDRIFIRKDFDTLVEKELLIPILLARDLKGNQLKWSGHHIINPYDISGKLINLDQFPRAQQYFEQHKEILCNRHVAKKYPHAWFKTIDKIHPRLTNKTKVILPDISGNTHLSIDYGQYYPHHNLYYITGPNDDKLIILAAILMSEFVKEQLSEIGNRMNGGYPRWQSQNLKKLRIPVVDAIPGDVQRIIKNAYHQKDYDMVNEHINKARISGLKAPAIQLALFEPVKKYGKK